MPATVLIADDNQFIRTLVKAALRPLGCEIIEACDGLEAIENAIERPPDLILLDVVMPQLDGFEVLHLLRKRPETAECLIAMLTTADTPADHALGREADDYIIKPFDNASLRAHVAAMLGM